MRIFTLVLATVLLHCGTDTSSESLEATKQSEKSPFAMSLENKDEMPICTTDNLKQLVYIKSEKKLYSCESEDWAEMALPRGEKGEKGEQGEQGEAYTADIWYDLINDMFVTDLVEVNYASAVSACVKPWKLMEASDLLKAAQRGLPNSNEFIWTTEAAATQTDGQGNPVYIQKTVRFANGALQYSTASKDTGLVDYRCVKYGE